jgi:hypothetical protein
MSTVRGISPSRAEVMTFIADRGLVAQGAPPVSASTLD